MKNVLKILLVFFYCVFWVNAKAADLTLPVDDSTFALTISSGWLYPDGSVHHGIDFAGEEECATPVLAAADGTVTYTKNSSCPNTYSSGVKTFGCSIEIEHTDGSHTKYSHLCEGTAQVAVGDEVAAGQYIAAVGNTGYSTGTHLDFRVAPQGCPDWNLSSSCLIDPYDIYQLPSYYPDSNTAAVCGNGYYWVSCPPEAEEWTMIVSNPSSPSTSDTEYLEGQALDRQTTKLRVIDTYAGYDVTQSAEYYLGSPFMSFERWFNDGEITYDDGVPSDAYIQRYGLLSNGDTNGVIIVYPDTGMAVEMWGHTWRFWERGSASGYSYVDNCGVSWFANGTGPRSEFGLPITTEYYADSNNRWRRDFQRGYMAWDPTGNVMYLNCYTEATPRVDAVEWLGR